MTTPLSKNAAATTPTQRASVRTPSPTEDLWNRFSGAPERQEGPESRIDVSFHCRFVVAARRGCDTGYVRFVVRCCPQLELQEQFREAIKSGAVVHAK